jgi:hypothetical protein
VTLIVNNKILCWNPVNIKVQCAAALHLYTKLQIDAAAGHMASQRAAAAHTSKK